MHNPHKGHGACVHPGTKHGHDIQCVFTWHGSQDSERLFQASAGCSYGHIHVHNEDNRPGEDLCCSMQADKCYNALQSYLSLQ